MSAMGEKDTLVVALVHGLTGETRTPPIAELPLIPVFYHGSRSSKVPPEILTLYEQYVSSKRSQSEMTNYFPHYISTLYPHQFQHVRTHNKRNMRNEITRIFFFNNNKCVYLILRTTYHAYYDIKLYQKFRNRDSF